jgi:hypothetical protein
MIWGISLHREKNLDIRESALMNRHNDQKSRLIKSAGFISSALFYLFFQIFTASTAAETQATGREINAAVVKFFKYVNEHSYQNAYDCFCRAIQQDIPYSRFKERASDILKATIMEKTVYECDEYLAKLRIKARIRIRYRGSCYDALYGGTCDLSKEDKKWKVASVSLKALEQKEILDKKPIIFSK